MRFYLDEDVNPEVAAILRGFSCDAVHAYEQGNISLPDEEHLRRAARQKRCLVTRNRDDYIRLTVEGFGGEPHAGVVIVPWSFPNSQASLIASALAEVARNFPEGVPPWTIHFLKR